jgi:hypothetical protein
VASSGRQVASVIPGVPEGHSTVTESQSQAESGNVHRVEQKVAESGRVRQRSQSLAEGRRVRQSQEDVCRVREGDSLRIIIGNALHRETHGYRTYISD